MYWHASFSCIYGKLESDRICPHVFGSQKKNQICHLLNVTLRCRLVSIPSVAGRAMLEYVAKRFVIRIFVVLCSIPIPLSLLAFALVTPTVAEQSAKAGVAVVEAQSADSLLLSSLQSGSRLSDAGIFRSGIFRSGIFRSGLVRPGSVRPGSVRSGAVGSTHCPMRQKVFLLGAVAGSSVSFADSCLDISLVATKSPRQVSEIATLVRLLVHGERPDVVVFSHRNAGLENGRIIDGLSRAYGFRALQLLEQPRKLLLPFPGVAV